VQLYRWQGPVRNFGDELNTLLWPRLLPGFLDDDPAELFLGIGSVLDARHNGAALKIVAGAGYGGYQAVPVLDASWIVHWVRGPRTARRLGLPEACGLGDPAMLLAVPGSGSGRSIGFMPHFESLARGAWAEAASAAGITLIDPRDEPATILTALGHCRVLLSEAMHGVIIADALRVPWIALRPIASVHRAKWYDWAETLHLQVRFHPLAASSLPERLYASPLASSHRGRRLLDSAGPALAGVARGRFVERAARSLAAAAAAPPQLSTDAALDRCRTRMLDRLDAVRRNPRRPAASALHPRGTSAYQG
jgi:succinoglycan biosynthesis protein ExoV